MAGICQLIGGLIWASCIGSICALLTTSNPAAVRFRQSMDELNFMMDSRGMGPAEQSKLRMFFINARSKREAEAQRVLLTEMSPMVRADTAGKFFGNQVRSVWYFRAASDGFISAVALALNTDVYTSGEAVDVEAKLGIVNRGLILWNAMVKKRGHILGEDFALSITLRRTGVAMAMTFIEMLTLEQQPFNVILAEAPEAEYKMIRKYLVRLTFIRAMIREAARISTEQGSNVMQKHTEALGSRGAKERVKSSRLAKITTLQGTDIEQNMPDWAKRLESTIFESMAEMKIRQGELQLQQEKLEEQNQAVLARLDQAMNAMAGRAKPGGIMYTPNGRLPDRSGDGCAGCVAEVGSKG